MSRPSPAAATDENLPRPSLRVRLRRKLGRMVEPRLTGFLEWCRAAEKPDDPVLDRINERIAALEGRSDRLEWGKDALVGRMNAQDCLIEHANNSFAELEPLVQDAYWGREALVERFNDADWRTHCVDETLKTMQMQIDEYVIRPLALELDTLAMSRRLATIEDQLEVALARIDRSLSAPAPLHAYRPDEAKAG